MVSKGENFPTETSPVRQGDAITRLLWTKTGSFFRMPIFIQIDRKNPIFPPNWSTKSKLSGAANLRSRSCKSSARLRIGNISARYRTKPVQWNQHQVHGCEKKNPHELGGKVLDCKEEAKYFPLSV
uniref:Uncharacterized protein n=1 Tax=Arundo donax TaxID=35708 RepID=A0A0A9A2H9_ARUDO